MKSTCMLVAMLFAISSVGPAQDWQFKNTISIPPPYAPVFAATTPRGDVAVGTFNNRQQGGPVDLPVILIHQPLSATPTFFVVCRNQFGPFRGYSGLAVDAQNNYYVAADTGDDATSWIRKFLVNGKPDVAFGQGGEVRPGRRVLGLEIAGEKLLTTLGFGQLAVLDRNTGRMVGTSAKPAPVLYVRDLAADPARQIVYAVAQGAAWVYEGGTFDNPSGYKPRRISPNVLETPRSGEGIYFDAVARRALIPEGRSGQLLSVSDSGQTQKSAILGATSNVKSIADAVLLADGQTLFVTDSTGGENGRCSIHVMQRSGGATVAPPSGDSLASLATVAGAAPAGGAPGVVTGTANPFDAAGAAAAASPTAGTVAWRRDVRAAFQEARTSGRKLLLYARSAESKRCGEVEKDLVVSPEFAASAGNYVAAWFDVSTDPKYSQQLGIFRVPTVATFRPDGERIQMWQGKLDNAAVLDGIK